MRNSPLKGLLSKKDKSPLEINPLYDHTFYDPKTQLALNRKGINVGQFSSKNNSGVSNTAKKMIKGVKNLKSKNIK